MVKSWKGWCTIYREECCISTPKASCTEISLRETFWSRNRNNWRWRSSIYKRVDWTEQISDFGMSREGEYYSVNSTEIPYRWSAPEVKSGHRRCHPHHQKVLIESKSTMASDVWSFGIVIWEIYNFGKRENGTVDLHIDTQQFLTVVCLMQVSSKWFERVTRWIHRQMHQNTS